MTATVFFAGLICVLLCLASWSFFFAKAHPRWRFEFFTFDFAVGAAVFGVALALLLGNSSLLSLQSDLSLGDRLLISGKTEQALTVFAGALFGLVFLTWFGAIRLLGRAVTFPFILGLAGFGDGLYSLRRTPDLLLSGGALLLLAAAILASVAARAQDPIMPPPAKGPRQPVTRNPVRKSTKGLILASFSAVLLALAAPLTASGLVSDLGVGPYAGILLLTPGLVISVVPFALILLNINIDLPPAGARGYWGAKRSQHFLGWSSGAVWALGMFAFFLLALGETATKGEWRWPAADVAAALTAAATLGFVRERDQTRKQGAELLSVVLLAAGLLVLSQAL